MCVSIVKSLTFQNESSRESRRRCGRRPSLSAATPRCSLSWQKAQTAAMGTYLSTPDTEKESESGSTADGWSFGISSMQGWRRSQEDAHIVHQLPNGTNVFGVFDGHGGREVSNFAKAHFADALTKQKTYGSDVGKALVTAFHRIDELLEDRANLEEVNSLKKDPRKEAEGEGGSSSEEAAGAASPDGEEEDGERKVSMGEAVEIFQRLMTLKKMAAGAPAGDGAAAGALEAAGAGAAPNGAAGMASGGGAPQMSAASLLSGGGFGDGQTRTCTLPPSHIEAGATSVVAAVRNGVLYVANAGDSRAVLCRRGTAVALSEDHKPALPTELARISRAGGWVTAQGRINGNLNLSRALGDLKYKGDKKLGRHEQIITAQPDVTQRKLEKGDEFIVLACDGVWDCMTNQEVVDFVRSRLSAGEKNLIAIAEAILDHCIAEDPKTTGGIGGDNMTCIIAKLPKM